MLAGASVPVDSIVSPSLGSKVTYAGCTRHFPEVINCGLLVLLATQTFTSRRFVRRRVRPKYTPGFNCLVSNITSSAVSWVDSKVTLAVMFCCERGGYLLLILYDNSLTFDVSSSSQCNCRYPLMRNSPDLKSQMHSYCSTTQCQAWLLQRLPKLEHLSTNNARLRWRITVLLLQSQLECYLPQIFAVWSVSHVCFDSFWSDPSVLEWDHIHCPEGMVRLFPVTSASHTRSLSPVSVQKLSEPCRFHEVDQTED